MNHCKSVASFETTKHWTLGLLDFWTCPKKHVAFRKLILFPPSGEKLGKHLQSWVHYKGPILISYGRKQILFLKCCVFVKNAGRCKKLSNPATQDILSHGQNSFNWSIQLYVIVLSNYTLIRSDVKVKICMWNIRHSKF
jgi:hypothetical protein